MSVCLSHYLVIDGPIEPLPGVSIANRVLLPELLQALLANISPMQRCGGHKAVDAMDGAFGLEVAIGVQEGVLHNIPGAAVDEVHILAQAIGTPGRCGGDMEGPHRLLVGSIAIDIEAHSTTRLSLRTQRNIEHGLELDIGKGGRQLANHLQTHTNIEGTGDNGLNNSKSSNNKTFY